MHHATYSFWILFVASAIAGGCSSYSVPGPSADFRALGISNAKAEVLTDATIQRRLERVPLARFPTAIAVVRVQGPEYRSYTQRGCNLGKVSIVTTRDVETDESYKRLSAMPMVNGVATLNRLVLPDQVTSEQDLRGAAAEVQADMLLVYTFDTIFKDEEKLAPMSLITLGLFPDHVANVTSTASAALLDTRDGYIYGLAESTGHEKKLASAWTSRIALDSARKKAEREAFDGLVGQVETMWKGVVTRYGPREAVTSAVSPNG